MKRSQIIWFEVITPGGLILRLDLDHAPEIIREDVKQDRPWEEIVVCLNRLTNCPCRMRTEISVACEQITKPIPKS